MGKHALYNPSGFQALMLCPAKPAMERGIEDEASDYADEGTAAHFLGAWCLERGEQAPLYLGRLIFVNDDASWDSTDGAKDFAVDTDFAEHVQTYIDLVRARLTMYEQLGATVELHVEQAVPIGHITGEEGAEGTADVVIIAVFPDGTALIEVIDLKFGRGVEVDAVDNPQLKLYGLGAAEKFGLLYDFKTVSTLISQPRIAREPSETAYSLADLQAWARDVAAPAARESQRIYALTDMREVEAHCKPHEDACRFCLAKPCKAMDAAVSSALQREFTDLTTASEPEREAIVETSVATADAAGDLGARMDAVPLVEMWCKAVRGRVEKHLLDGRPVAGYKLVQGKKGNRQWSDETEAEKALLSTLRKRAAIYKQSLISPTDAEKVLKTKPKTWKKLQPLITQSDGKPSVAPITDKRPALEVKPLESEFTPITDGAPATADDLV